MKFLELKYEDKLEKDPNIILDIINKENLNWLNYCDIENAKIEIKKGTLIWNAGYFSGNWHYGIFKGGEFHGVFQNGIIEGGNFHGEFKSGIKLIEI
jgi:hypothetical protein